MLSAKTLYMAYVKAHADESIEVQPATFAELSDTDRQVWYNLASEVEILINAEKKNGN